MSSIFTKIILGDIPCHKIAENDQFFAFLDIRPIAPGHTLVIPKIEIDRFFDLDNDHLANSALLKPIAAIETVVLQPCGTHGRRVGVSAICIGPHSKHGDLSFLAKPATNDDLSTWPSKSSKIFNSWPLHIF